MGDRNQVRDRTLVLRVLVPSLETRLRDKMKEAEEQASSSQGGGGSPTGKTTPGSNSSSQQQQLLSSSSLLSSSNINNNSNSIANNNKEITIDLDGVTCEPIQDGSTLWKFHCDGATYPARLVNLPCPVEIHKTHDHAMYYKSADVAQLLIVYEDQMALDDAEQQQQQSSGGSGGGGGNQQGGSGAAMSSSGGTGIGQSNGGSSPGYPSYYHSGITPPLKRVVERRFETREHKAIPPPKSEVSDVEQEMKKLIERITNKETGTGRGKSKKNSQQSSSGSNNKIIEEIIEDVVDYEPWMDDYGRLPYGVEFDEQDVKCTKHPEIWLDPAEIAKITNKVDKETKNNNDPQLIATAFVTTTKKDKSSKKNKDGTTKKKSKKKNKDANNHNNIDTSLDISLSSKPPSSKKKGIASKKQQQKELEAKQQQEEVDEVAQIAAQMTSLDNNDDINFEVLDGMFTFDDDDPLKNMDMEF